VRPDKPRLAVVDASVGVLEGDMTGA
jgi:hypothetical protein